VLAWLGREGGWRRRVGPVLLLLSVVPIAYSLNRALWLSLVVAGVYVGVRLALNGRIWAVQALLGAALVTGVALTATPLYDVVTLRLETPHSNERRLNIAEQVVTTTWQGSPLVGYGSTRDVEGSFASVAGGSTESCQGCKPPPLGTQGFLWRLLLTTGFAGTALCLGFLLDQLRRHSRGARPFAVTGCTVVVVSLLLFLVYDSLESPFFTLMIAVALMVREDMGRKEGEHETSPGGP
jgi:O-antigen ligase